MTTMRRAWYVGAFDWRVDPGAPAVPTDDAGEVDAWAALTADAPRRSPEAMTQRLRMRSLMAEHELAGRIHATRSMLDLVRAVREVCLDALSPPPPRARHAGGRPTNVARNDRLLALYEATAERLHKLQRCRLAAKHYAHEQATSAGRDPEREHVLPASTARDAIAEARARRDKRA